MPLQMADRESKPSAITVWLMLAVVTHIGVSRTAGMLTAVSVPGLSAVVDSVGADQAHRQGQARTQVESGSYGSLSLEVDRLVNRTALVTSEDVLHALDSAVLTGRREGEGLHAIFLQVSYYRVVQAVVGDNRSVDVRVRGEGLEKMVPP